MILKFSRSFEITDQSIGEAESIEGAMYKMVYMKGRVFDFSFWLIWLLRRKSEAMGIN